MSTLFRYAGTDDESGPCAEMWKGVEPHRLQPGLDNGLDAVPRENECREGHWLHLCSGAALAAPDAQDRSVRRAFECPQLVYSVFWQLVLFLLHYLCAHGVSLIIIIIIIIVINTVFRGHCGSGPKS